MDYQLLGATGLTVSALGIGCGGPSKLGLRGGGEHNDAVAVVREALDRGVNFIDTAEAYGTEPVVAEAIRGIDRETLVVSTKISHYEELDSSGVVASVDARLRELGTEYLDICHFHAVTLERYERVAGELRDGLLKARDAGKVRFLGVTEMFNHDPGHTMLATACDSNLWDVVMVGFNVLNQSARGRVFPQTLRRGIGVLDMFAVRLALSRAERLVEVMDSLVASGAITREAIEEAGGTREAPLGWVVEESDAETLVEAAYRFVRHEEAIHVTLSGTGNLDHLRQNIATVQLPPLPAPVVQKLVHLFEGVDSVSAQ